MDRRTVRPLQAPPARELLALRSASRTFLTMIEDAEQWAEQVSDLNRVVQPEYSALLDGLRDQLRVALRPSEMGTPAAIAAALAELLGEARL
jgi:hypothetical protein